MHTVLASVNDPNAGCCYVGQNFYELGCNNFTVPVGTLGPDCQLYRSSCPLATCNTLPGSVLDATTQQCKMLTTINVVSPDKPQVTDDQKCLDEYKGITIALAIVTSLLALVLIVTCTFYRSKLTSMSSGNLTDRLLNSDEL